MGALRIFVETRWFERFWQVRRSYARHLALQNEQDRAQRRANGLPLRSRSTWELLRERLSV